MFDLASTGLLQGLLLSIVTIGVMIPFRLLNFPDLTAEGAYPLGGALCATLILTGLPPLFATILCCAAGGILGLCTAFVHIRFKVNTLLAGIILSIMVYSVNLRILGKPNLSLFEEVTLFSDLSEMLFLKITILLLFNCILLLLIYRFLISEKGLRLRSVGLNPEFSERQGIKTSFYVFLGLFFGNALSSIAGSLMVQNQSYADIGMGIGIVIHALAALLIGESIVGTQTLKRQLLASIVGALIYQQIQGITLSLGLSPSDLKFVTGGIVLFIMGFSRYRLSESNC